MHQTQLRTLSMRMDAMVRMCIVCMSIVGPAGCRRSTQENVIVRIHVSSNHDEGVASTSWVGACTVHRIHASLGVRPGWWHVDLQLDLPHVAGGQVRLEGRIVDVLRNLEVLCIRDGVAVVAGHDWFMIRSNLTLDAVDVICDDRRVITISY